MDSMLQLSTAERVRPQEAQPRRQRPPGAEPAAVTAEAGSMPAPSRSTGRSLGMPPNREELGHATQPLSIGFRLDNGLFIDATRRGTGRTFQHRTTRGRGFNER